MSLTTVESWLETTAEKVGGIFLAAFLGPLALAGLGAFNLASLKAAAYAGAAAAVAALDSIVGNLIHPQATSIWGALKTRHSGA